MNRKSNETARIAENWYQTGSRAQEEASDDVCRTVESIFLKMSPVPCVKMYGLSLETCCDYETHEKTSHESSQATRMQQLV